MASIKGSGTRKHRDLYLIVRYVPLQVRCRTTCFHLLPKHSYHEHLRLRYGLGGCRSTELLFYLSWCISPPFLPEYMYICLAPSSAFEHHSASFYAERHINHISRRRRCRSCPQEGLPGHGRSRAKGQGANKRPGLLYVVVAADPASIIMLFLCGWIRWDM